jgi:hypothetical protein
MRPIKNILLVLAIAGLASILLFSILYAGGRITFQDYKLLLIVGSLVWFGSILTRNRISFRNQVKNTDA